MVTQIWTYLAHLSVAYPIILHSLLIYLGIFMMIELRQIKARINQLLLGRRDAGEMTMALGSSPTVLLDLVLLPFGSVVKVTSQRWTQTHSVRTSVLRFFIYFALCLDAMSSKKVHFLAGSNSSRFPNVISYTRTRDPGLAQIHYFDLWNTERLHPPWPF